ncbi:hypothetical protein ES703_49789 [subsurface metagenome]
MINKETTRVSDVLPVIDFHPDLPKKPLAEILDKECLISDIKVIRNFQSEFGESDFALLLLRDLVTGEYFTTLCGGMVVVKKCQYLLDNALLPIKGMITFAGKYYDLN